MLLCARHTRNDATGVELCLFIDFSLRKCVASLCCCAYIFPGVKKVPVDVSAHARYM